MMSNGSSIDPHRLALEASSAEWFKWVTWYGYAVAFGCAMEVWEVSVTIKNWWLFRFRNVEAEENKKSWASPIAAIGLLIIVVGIVLETYCEGKSASAETELRNYFSEKLTAAEQASADAVRDAGAAKESASAAGASALVAKGAADKAVTASSSALSNVQTLGVRTAALDKGLLMRGDRSSLLEKREVTFRIANALGPQNGDSVLIWYNSDKPKSDGLTDETYLTAYEVHVIFQIGKWWNTPIPVYGHARTARGMFFHVSPRASAATRANAQRIAKLFEDAPLQVAPALELGNYKGKPSTVSTPLVNSTDFNAIPLQDRGGFPMIGDSTIVIEIDPHP